MDFEEWFDGLDLDNWTNKKYMHDAFEAGQQRKQAQINKALELLRQPMQGTVADLLNDLEDILNDT